MLHLSLKLVTITLAYISCFSWVSSNVVFFFFLNLSQVGGPYWPVSTGRRDGLTANETAANEQIPSPIEPLENITAKFTSKGLTLNDMVVLSGLPPSNMFSSIWTLCLMDEKWTCLKRNSSFFFILFHTGAHTIGFAQCFTFKSRLFNFDNTGNPDPTLDASLLQSLQQICPNQDESNSNLAPLDSVTTDRFDNVYYKNLENNSGLLQSDQALMGNNRTASLVMLYNRFPNLFATAFRRSMMKMSYIGVLKGNDGEIRKNCRVVN